MAVRNAFTFAGGQVLATAQMNGRVSGLMGDVAGDNGPIQLRGSIRVPAGAYYLLVPASASATGAAGRMRWANNRMEIHNGTGWGPFIQTNSVVTFHNLNANGDVGDEAGQVSFGNHGH